MDPLETLQSLGGVARVGALRQAGFSERALRGLTAAGAFKPRKGVWALPGADQEFLAAILNNSLLTCGSSAARHGLWIKDVPRRLHLTSRHPGTKLSSSHGKVRFPPDDRFPIAGVEDTVIHALTCLPEVDAIAVAQSAMKFHGVPRAVLEAELNARYYGTARARLVKADGISESVPEISARLLFESAGLDFRRQVKIEGVGRVDFLVSGWLIVEVNGYKFHSSRVDWRKDMARLNAAQLLGYGTLNYAPEQVWNSPDHVLTEIRAMLQRGRP